MSQWKKWFLEGEAFSEPLLWLQRKETWRGDQKANRLRFLALAVFAVNELVNYHLLHVVDLRFHIGSLLIVFIWTMAALSNRILLERHWLPRSLPFFSAAVDAFLLTWLLFLGDGPRSPLAHIYFLIVALSVWRLNPRVVFFTTAVCAFGYLCAWDFAKHQKPEALVPLHHLVIVLLSLGFEGLILSHGVSRVLTLLGQTPKQADRP